MNYRRNCNENALRFYSLHIKKMLVLALQRQHHYSTKVTSSVRLLEQAYYSSGLEVQIDVVENRACG
jgi:hypothetical protein